ncbi:2-dehydro-3-deoxygalactonokinase [Ancylobacter sp. MQZ15Z-1]|uniref:2-dehydro-3-deoxygalactonokinase n=1 Tax=Ancylobacter mangrovi TaxID=2972472 RepID=A0A9X2T183_9HYPH|nr:2-dehydro-3-deoxygalactonokinase [Ancylobacter mangrovi]MCS0494452.1 2-dehydro-3-deoxygalactonokinase [Ancylobacter mangrovi]
MFCAAVDWGTSSFRLWLLDRAGMVVAERRSDEGMQHCHRVGFAPVLEAHLAAAGAPTGLPVMICGMAGARQGWQEAGYLDLPARLDTLPEQAIRIAGAAREVFILPGLAQRRAEAPDVIRGEETQLLGVLDASDDTRLFCLPGTHSKWVAVEQGAVTRFATFMTGELFALLSRHSILAHAMPQDMEVREDAPRFLEGVEDGASAPEAATRRLFGLRASQLLGFSDRGDGAAYLSGLLIGVEIAGARAFDGGEKALTLLAGGPLARLYERALTVHGYTVATRDAGEATRRGLHQAALRRWPHCAPVEAAS